MKIQRFAYYIFFAVLSYYPSILCGQNSEKKTHFFSRGSYFMPVILDPTECISSGGLLSIYENGGKNQGIYIPVNIGLQQSILRFQKTDHSGIEFGFGAAAFTQFIVKQPDNGKYLGEIENTDFKASGFFNFLFNQWSARLRLFHISSHLADDYILRNNIDIANPGTLNYEQLDLTASYNRHLMRYYLGIGTVITTHAVRKRLSLQTGTFFRKQVGSSENVRVAGGIDIKIFEQNDFRPNIKSSVGIELGATDKIHFGLFAEYYNGHLPYSILEYKIVQWIGVTGYIIPAWR